MQLKRYSVRLFKAHNTELARPAKVTPTTASHNVAGVLDRRSDQLPHLRPWTVRSGVELSSGCVPLAAPSFSSSGRPPLIVRSPNWPGKGSIVYVVPSY